MPIFDQGYQHWQGKLSGHTWRWLAITRHGVRVQMKNRIVRILVLFAWVVPAGLLVAAVAIWGMVEQKNEGAMGIAALVVPEMLSDPKAFRVTFWTLAYWRFFQAEMIFTMLLVVIAGPGLISRDLRFNALPLYFARPLARLDYFLGKLGIIGYLVGAIVIAPAAIAYVVGVCFSLDLSVVRDTYHVLFASVAYGLVVSLSVGTFILGLSSLSRRSLYIGITWAGIWIISGAVGSILTEVHRQTAPQGIYEDEMRRWVAENPPPPGVQMSGTQALIRQPGPGAANMGGAQDQAARRYYAAWSEASAQAWEKVGEGKQGLLRRDWRPMCSYVTNLERIGAALFEIDTAWVQVGKAEAKMKGAFGPTRRGGPHGFVSQPNERDLANQHVDQYPWVWSAGLLAGLMGLSVWTLTRRVKSLDRLK